MRAETCHEQLSSVLVELRDLLSRENDALTRHDHAAVEETLPNKISLVRLYQAQVAAVANNPGLASELDEHEHEELRAVAGEIEALMEDNVRLLKVGIECSSTLLEGVMHEARKQRQQDAVGYTRRGEFEPLGAASLQINDNF